MARSNLMGEKVKKKIKFVIFHQLVIIDSVYNVHSQTHPEETSTTFFVLSSCVFILYFCFCALCDGEYLFRDFCCFPKIDKKNWVGRVGKNE